MKLPSVPTVIAATFAATIFAGVVAGPALAQGGGGDVRTVAKCSTSSTIKLKAKPDNGRIQIEAEVDSNRVGQTWSTRLTDNNVRVFAGNKVTLAPSGSFSVRVLAPNRAGTDTIVATARNVRTGETCKATVRL